VASITNVNTSGLNFSGLATGIDTDKIITGLTKINQNRIDLLKSRESGITTKQTAFAQIKGLLFDFQSKTTALARSAGGSFDGRKATVSDTTIATAVAGTSAVPGTYTLSVSALAKANQVASQGFVDPNAQIKQGSVSLQVGTGSAISITVDSRNNTLQGLADSINAAGGDVKASIINDGSATPYRLALTATKTGAVNAINVTNNLTTGAGADINLTNNTLQAASDAVVKLGSGAGALTVTSASNQLNGLIPGVTLNVAQADPSKTFTLTVSNDTDATKTALKDFVNSYNATIDFISSQSKFDSKTQTAGVLLGNRDAAGIADELAQALSTTIPGLSSSANRISSVGLSLGDNRKLTLDEGKLDQALSGQTGATLGDLKRLFAISGTTDNPGVAFVFGSNTTKPSGTTPYQVNVTAPATRAVVTASTALGSSIVLTPPNNSLSLKLNGLTASGVTLDPGTYTAEELVSLLQQKINSNSSLNGNLVTVGLTTDNKLTITSQRYGAGSTISFGPGTNIPGLGFTGSETAVGTDVKGEFRVDGLVEAATGTGQTLTGVAGNKNTDGLQVRATTNTATTANLTVTQGLAGRVNSILGKYLNTTSGRLKTIDDGFQKQVDDIEKNITGQNDMLETKKNALLLRFAAMESAVSNLKGLQSQLTAMFSSISSK
jgi:flagellar hook-associated protein 2